MLTNLDDVAVGGWVAGGIFLDMASHDFDMARFLVGSEIEEVSDIMSLPARTAERSLAHSSSGHIQHRVCTGPCWLTCWCGVAWWSFCGCGQVFVQAAAWGPEAQTAKDFDTQITLLRFANGVFGTIENSRRCAFGWAGGGCHRRWGRHAASDSCLSVPCGVVVVCRYDQRVELFGEKGALQGNNRAPNTVVRSDSTGVVACMYEGRERASRSLESPHPPISGQALTGLTEHASSCLHVCSAAVLVLHGPLQRGLRGGGQGLRGQHRGQAQQLPGHGTGREGGYRGTGYHQPLPACLANTPCLPFVKDD